ncbi:glycosyltransferase family 4 protein [Candidatus Microgenomates bacterium]|nr:glycosyltransferase family 4 protein [Candidatus Microgenomates bacterium]
MGGIIMIIGIDTRVAPKKKTGMGVLLENILKAMFDIDDRNCYKLLGDGFFARGKNIKIFSLGGIVKRGFNFLWKFLHFPPANFLIGRTDVFFFTNFVDFPIWSKKKILLIPDTTYLVHSRFVEKKNLYFLKKNVFSSAKRADIIVTISHNSKIDIMKYYGLPEEKIKVIYPAVSLVSNTHNDLSSIAKKYNLRKPYILFVGTIEPRKNINTLIDAYAMINGNLLEKYDLIVAGGKGWQYQKVFDAVKKIKKGNVIFTGYADKKDLSSLYANASLFVFPSFYEGFGLPVLDAMSYGVPTICSGNSSLPEVGGDAVIYCDPYDTKKLSTQISDLLNDKKRQNQLKTLGRTRAKQFSWEKSASALIDILLK